MVDTVFSHTDATGYTLTHAILPGDAPQEQASFPVWTLGVAPANLTADVAYGMADRRVHYD